jgi:tetratricopeptide (TPR) repeat protein
MSVIVQGGVSMFRAGSATFAGKPLPTRAGWIRVACPLAALLLIGLPASAGQNQDTPQTSVTIRGTVRSIAGRSLGLQVEVLLEGENGVLLTKTLTNSDGAYYFFNVTDAGYRIIVTAPGFQRFEGLIPSAIGLTMRIYNISLTPLPKTGADGAAAPPRTDSRVPRKARKDYEKATKEMKTGHPDKAEAQLQRAVKTYPCYVEAQAHLATLLETHDERAGAEAALRKAIQCDPDYVPSYTLLGQLLNGQQRFAESVPVLEAGQRRLPSSWPLCYELGIAYFHTGQYSKAAAQFQNVSSFTPSPPADLPLRLADVYIKQRAYAKAYSEMKRYLKAQPNGPYAAKVRGIVDRVDASGLLKPQP